MNLANIPGFWLKYIDPVLVVSRYLTGFTFTFCIEYIGGATDVFSHPGIHFGQCSDILRVEDQGSFDEPRRVHGDHCPCHSSIRYVSYPRAFPIVPLVGS